MLSDNYLGEAGAISLAESLVSNKSLKELCLKGNELADAGVKALCDALHVSGGGEGLDGIGVVRMAGWMSG